MAEVVQVVGNNSWKDFFILEFMGKAHKAGLNIPLLPGKGLEISMTINGVACPVIDPLDTLQLLGETYDTIVEKSALMLLEQQLDKQLAETTQLMEGIKEKLKEKVSELTAK